jgi:hypothetical protein
MILGQIKIIIINYYYYLFNALLKDPIKGASLEVELS